MIDENCKNTYLFGKQLPARYANTIRFFIYLIGAALAVILLNLINYIFSIYLPGNSTPLVVIKSLITIFSLALILIGLRAVGLNFARSTLMKDDLVFSKIIPELSEKISQESDIKKMCELILAEVEERFNVSDAQLTIYYDQPIALEVTHVRLKDNRVTVLVERVREDIAELDQADGEALTPITALETELLTHRDRLVGMLLIGPRRDGKTFNDYDRNILNDMVPVISSGIDQLMMIRSVSETNQRLFESEKLVSIGQLASGIAHEIRNPLTSMKMNLQGLKRSSELNEKNQRRMTICLDEIDRLDGIVSEVMHFARRTKLTVMPTDAKRLINASLDLAKSELKDKEIEINVRIEEGIPEIKVDENRILRVLINLFINASQAMEKGGIITVTAEPYGAGVEIQVADNGPGIPEEMRRESFNPFFTTKAGGTGLGLANALKFVQEHGGELDCSSEVGMGTTFSMRLPPVPPTEVNDPSSLRVMPT